MTTTAPAPPPPAPPRGLLIGAIIVGGVAFLIGWVPFLGALAAIAGIILGIFALRARQQPAVLAIIGLILSGLALLTSIGLTAATIAQIGQQSDSASAPQTQTAPEPMPTTSATTAPPPAPEPTQNAADDTGAIAAFAAEAHGHIADIDKDLDDMVMRTTNAQHIRLLGNTIELSFNLAQLSLLTPPSTLQEQWSTGLAQLEASITSLNEAVDGHVGGSVDAATVFASIEACRAQNTALDAIVGQLG